MFEVGQRVIEQEPAKRHDGDDSQYLEGPSAHLGIGEQRTPGLDGNCHRNPLESPPRSSLSTPTPGGRPHYVDIATARRGGGVVVSARAVRTAGHRYSTRH